MPRVARGEAKRLDDRAQAGLRGQARHRGHGSVGNVEPDLGTLEDAGGLGPADVMGVKVDRHAHFLTQGLDQFLGGERLAQAGHVLDGDQVRASLLQLSGHREIVLEVVLGASGIEDIAGVADGRLAKRAGLAHGLQRCAPCWAPS